MLEVVIHLRTSGRDLRWEDPRKCCKYGHVPITGLVLWSGNVTDGRGVEFFYVSVFVR